MNNSNALNNKNSLSKVIINTYWKSSHPNDPFLLILTDRNFQKLFPTSFNVDTLFLLPIFAMIKKPFLNRKTFLPLLNSPPFEAHFEYGQTSGPIICQVSPFYEGELSNDLQFVVLRLQIKALIPSNGDPVLYGSFSSDFYESEEPTIDQTSPSLFEWIDEKKKETTKKRQSKESQDSNKSKISFLVN